MKKALLIAIFSSNLFSINTVIAKETNDKGLMQATPAQWCKAKKAERLETARMIIGELFLNQKLKPELGAALIDLAQDKAKLEKALKAMAGELEIAMTTAMCEKDGSVNPKAKNQAPAFIAILAATFMGWLKF